jgi:hypothetical protein
MIGKWNQNIIEGLAIYFSPETGEQLWNMRKNKLKNIYTNEEEIAKFKLTEEYLTLEEFYKLINNIK